jgi:hypothetical protein
MGYPGFETQMLIWLAGRIDANRLRQAIVRLARRHPAITARLVEPDSKDGMGPYWQLRPDVKAELAQIDLASDEPQAVLTAAEGLLSTPHDPLIGNPLRFHLLHRPGGHQVLLLQYNHALMDNSATPPLVRELNELCRSPESTDEPPRFEPHDLVRRRLARVPHAERRRASAAAIELQGRTLRGRAAILGKGDEDKPRTPRLRIATRTLEPDLTRAIGAQSTRLCGLPSLSMTILAAVFRAIGALGPQGRNADRNYIAGIGLDLNLRGGGQALLQNLLSVVAITAAPSELADRDTLIRNLSRQMRERLEDRIDLGILRLALGFQRRPRHRHWVLAHLLRWCYSLWYAYFGSLDSAGRDLAGVPIEQIQYLGPTWSPMGIALLANQYRGRLLLQLTYDPDLVSDPLAQQWLDRVVDDLTGFAS